jgi:hypothetical protein
VVEWGRGDKGIIVRACHYSTIFIYIVTLLGNGFRNEELKRIVARWALGQVETISNKMGTSSLLILRRPALLFVNI